MPAGTCMCVGRSVVGCGGDQWGRECKTGESMREKITR